MPALVAVLAGIVMGHLSGGSIRNLASLHLRGEALIVAAFALQAIARGRFVAVAGYPSMAVGAWVVASVALTITLLANTRIPGALVCALGVMLNLLVVLANGAMPVGHVPGAVEVSSLGQGVAASFYRFTDASTLAAFAGDVLPLRLLSMAMLLSIGDVLLMAGVCTAVVASMLSRPDMGSPDTQLGIKDSCTIL